MSTRSDIARSIASVARNKDDLPPPYTGRASDRKPPPLRSDAAMNEAAVELLKLFDRKVKNVCSACGIEQEFFLIDRSWYGSRADLALTGRTLAGAPPPKDRVFENQCGGSINERVHDYVNDVIVKAYKLGIHVDACRNGAAPNQYEFAQKYEKSDFAVYRNMLLTDIMKKIAIRHNVVCLPHEKPFNGVNGSGKRLFWSLSDDAGNNLLDPGDTAEKNLIFLTLFASVIYAVYRRGDLLRAAAASAGNEERLGGSGAPSDVMSVSIGEQLTKIIAAMEAGKTEKGKKRDSADLGLPPKFVRDATDCNSVWPIAFTGTMFEFRTFGSSTDVSTAVTTIDTIVADSIKTICERIKKELDKGKGDKNSVSNTTAVGSAAKGADESADNGVNQQHGDAAQSKPELTTVVMNVLAAVIKESKSILFDGDSGPSEPAKEEARTRGLQNIVSVPEALKAFIAPKAVELFERLKVFSEAELKAMYNVRLEQYEKTIDIEIKTLTDIVNTQVLPAAYNYQADIASGLEVLRVLADDMTIEMTDGALEDRKEMFEKLTADIYCLRKSLKELTAAADKARGMGLPERAAYLFKEIKPKMDGVRRYVDVLEGSMPDESWPLPKYKEMLFIL